MAHRATTLLLLVGCNLCAPRPSRWIHSKHLSPDLLAQDVIYRCVQKLRPLGWGKSLQESGPVVMTYATQIPNPWMLGVTAAVHGFPLVVAGLGMQGWNWWEGVVIQKTAAPRRAAQLVQAMLGDVPTALVDSGDVLVVNQPSAGQRRVLDQLGSTVMLGAECNSWPICYLAAYEEDAEAQRCLGRHGACFANGGVAIARSATLVDFLSAFRKSGEFTLNSSNGAERGNDQSALHHLYLNRTKFPSVRVHLDSASRFSLQLWTCNGGKDDGPSRRKRGGPFEYCHHHTHEPLKQVAISSSGQALSFNETRLGHVQHPIFVHSNGYHFRLQDPIFARLLAQQDASRLPAELFEQPVLLVESHVPGIGMVPCSMCSLGWLINNTRYPGGAPGVYRSANASID